MRLRLCMETSVMSEQNQNQLILDRLELSERRHACLEISLLTTVLSALIQCVKTSVNSDRAGQNRAAPAARFHPEKTSSLFPGVDPSRLLAARLSVIPLHLHKTDLCTPRLNNS